VGLLALPLLALLNGCTGYLGLRTVANYSMFSNLRTEAGQTNHWFASVLALERVGFSRDLVEVFDVQIPPRAQPRIAVRLHGGNYWLRRQSRWMRETLPVRIPWIELRRSVLLWKDAGLRDVRLRYVRNGQVHLVPDATLDPVLTAPLPWWIRKFVAFRAVQPDTEPVRCRW
jgi:hypothetical protein